MPDVFTQAMRHDDRWQVLSPAERMRLVDKLPGEEIERTLPTLISAR